MNLNPLTITDIFFCFLIYNIVDSDKRKEYLTYIYAMEKVFFKWWFDESNKKSTKKDLKNGG